MKKNILHVLSIVLGNVLVAFAISTLLVEHNIVVGGLSGLGIVIEQYFGIPLSIVVAICNTGLFLLGWWILGKGFAITTLLSTLIFPILLQYFEGAKVFQSWMPDPLLSSVIGGSLVGLGLGLVMRVGASTGGVDILALMIAKKKNIPVHIVYYVIDCIILLLQISLRDTMQIIYGIIAVILSSLVLKKVLTSGTALTQILVISEAYEQIRLEMLHRMDVGVTLLLSEKGYSATSSRMLLTVVPYHKLAVVRECIYQIDPVAFVIVSQVAEVTGRGFSLAR